jgi:hypothetical protein
VPDGWQTNEETQSFILTSCFTGGCWTRQIVNGRSANPFLVQASSNNPNARYSDCQILRD